MLQQKIDEASKMIKHRIGDDARLVYDVSRDYPWAVDVAAYPNRRIMAMGRDPVETAHRAIESYDNLHSSASGWKAA